MTLASPFKKAAPVPNTLEPVAPPSVRSAHINFRAVIEQMQLARSRYQIKLHQMKFDFSLEAVTRTIEDEDEDSVGDELNDDEYKDILSNFIDILVSRRGFGVSDPRDMIFAHAALVHHLNISNPNYNHSIAQVFEGLARHHIKSMQSYEIFSYVEILEPHERRQELTSWVPDWTWANPSPPVRIMQHTGSVYPNQDDMGSFTSFKGSPN
jgi:hypothetical protein